MERKSGFKECPRCGLRNKPSAAQCDFCGWEFQDTSEEWISHVEVLEKLNRQTESIMLDDEVSKRIESTIVRTSRDIKISPLPLDIPRVKEERPLEGELKAKGKDWAAAHMQTPSMPTPESKEVKAFVDTMIGEPTKAGASADILISDSGAIGMATAPISPVKELGKSPRIATFATKAEMLPYGLIAAGVGIYFVTLIIFALSIAPLPLRWMLAIVGALLITVGTSYVYDRSSFGKRRAASAERNASNEKERLVLICPNCNEEVTSNDHNCPACGARFAK